MAPSVAYARASTIYLASTPSVLRCSTLSATKRHRVVPVRSLWWWSRHGTWSSSNDENIDERIQRHQKIMRHRFSRALRRRAMWDREDNASSWMWRSGDGRVGRRWGACRTMSSTDPRMARLDDKHEGISSPQQFWSKTKKDFEKFDKEFESYRAAIDRAIEQDPYAVLFGRRMQSPPTENNSSWISWFLKGGSDKHDSSVQKTEVSIKKTIPIEVVGEESDAVKSQKVTSQAEEATFRSVSDPADMPEYIYDPISGRKAPRKSLESNNTAQPEQSFLESLFSEHGASSDKPVKQVKIYGHEPKLQIQSSESQDTRDKPGKNITIYESSRKRQYQQLRAATLGNSIDTTAEFGGKWEEPSAEQEPVESRIRKVAEPAEDAPLFSGTAYASKAEDIFPTPTKPTPSWLEKEGFAQASRSSFNSSNNTSSLEQRLEPSLDRITRTSQGIAKQTSNTKLQPAMERMQPPKQKTASITVRQPMSVMSAAQADSTNAVAMLFTDDELKTDKREDIDLLRASDIRASTKSIRITKQEAETAKVKERNKLENEFEEMQHKKPTEAISDAKQLRADSNRLSQSIDNVWKRAERHPNGVVAKTMKSMGMENEKFKDYEKPYNPALANLLEKLDFSSDSLNKLPSIYKEPIPMSKSSDSHPIHEFSDPMKARTDLIEALRLSMIQADKVKKQDNAQIEELANDIRMIYEAECGPIHLPLAQNSIPTKSTSAPDTTNQKDKNVVGVDSKDFFAEQAEFVSEVNQLSKDVRSVMEKAIDFETQVNQKLLTPDAASANYKLLTKEAESHLKKAESLHIQYDTEIKVKQPHPLSTATVKPGVPRYPAIERHTQVFEPKFVSILQDIKSVRRHLQEISTTLHDLRRSRVGQVVQRGNTGSAQLVDPRPLRSKVESENMPLSLPISSPYVILVYNKVTGEVDQTAMENLPWSLHEKSEMTNPIRIMGNLNYPAAFVTRFVELEKAGYELTSGGGDMLIFHCKIQSSKETEWKGINQPLPSSGVLRNVIAAEKASAQPEITETIAQPKSQILKQAATVLDEIPVEAPAPGPAAPRAPPTTPLKKTQRSGPKVRRQEQVFSGTLPLRPSPSKPQQSDQSKDQNSDDSSSFNKEQASAEEPTLFARTTRTIKRGVLGVVAFSAAAYTIGVVAEGIGAQAQVEGDTVIGPRTKVVMPVGQRAGIYSTESSRE